MHLTKLQNVLVLCLNFSARLHRVLWLAYWHWSTSALDVWRRPWKHVVCMVSRSTCAECLDDILKIISDAFLPHLIACVRHSVQIVIATL